MDIDRNTVEKNRLQKKINKLIKQRDHWKNEYEQLSHILKIYPYLRDDHSRYERDVAARKERLELRERVKEQVLLIRILMKDETLQSYEIKNAYDEVIREQNARLNEQMKANK